LRIDSAAGVDQLYGRGLGIEADDLRRDARRKVSVNPELEKHCDDDFRILGRRNADEPRVILVWILRVLRASGLACDDQSLNVADAAVPPADVTPAIACAAFSSLLERAS
jgi:hypothetical protein